MTQWCWVNFQCRGVLLIWIQVVQGFTVLAVSAGGGCLDIFFLLSIISLSFSLSLKTARYGLKYCLKGPLSPKQPTNQPKKLLHDHFLRWGWSGGAMALGKLPVPGRPTIWMIVEQGPIALAEVAVGGCLDIFILLYLFSPHSPPLWETARYSLKYCLEGPFNPKQPTNQLP